MTHGSRPGAQNSREKPVVATSYLDIDARFADVLEKSGFAIAGIRGMGLKRSIDMGKVMPDETERFARDVANAARGADGILICCGNLPTIDFIAKPINAETS